MDLIRRLYQFDDLIRWGGHFVLIAIVFAETGLMAGFFLPGDSLLVTAGLFASAGHLNIAVLILELSVAAILGDSLSYSIGRRLGPRLFSREDSLLFRKSHLHRTKLFYKKYGSKTIVLARFVPVVRTFAPVVAGVGEMNYPAFLTYNVMGGDRLGLRDGVHGIFFGARDPERRPACAQNYSYCDLSVHPACHHRNMERKATPPLPMTVPRWRCPLFLSGLVLLSQAFPLPSPVRDAATLQWIHGFSMHYPLWHLVFTPFCGMADALTVLSYHQIVATLLWTFPLFFIGGGFRKGLVLTFLFFAFAAWGAFIPRSMGRLTAEDPSILFIDFHSHSSYSHDGRPMFTPERNMAWHQAQGYAASFITDHNRVEASQIAKRESGSTWQETGYRSLEGEEVSLKKTHLVILGNHERVDNKPYDSDGRKIPVFVADMHSRHISVIASLPEYWFYHWDKTVSSQWGQDNGTVQDFVDWGMDGFEIINSAPKALDFPHSYRAQIVDLCRSKNLFITGISDNHGYGYATAVWNALRIPGWQTMDPDLLETVVLRILKRDRFKAVQVVERVKFFPESVSDLVFTPFGTLWIYWRSLQVLQAVSWVLWIWVVSLLYPSLYEMAE